MNQDILISIIVPVYNAKNYLRDCVDSIRKQTYHNIEILLINDGSQDNSLAICEKLSILDDRIKIYHQENQGVSATRNRGIELAKGEYILFVDSDDKIANDMVEQMLLRTEKNWLVICDYKKFRDNISITVQNEEMEVIELDGTNFWDLYKKNIINPPWNKLYEKEILLKGIRFSKELSLGEDLLFNLEYFVHIEGVIYLKKAFYYYRDLEIDSLSNKYYENRFEIQIKLYQKLIEFCQTQKNWEEIQWGELYWYYFKSLQTALDIEYEKNFYKEDNIIIRKMENKEFKTVLDKIRKNKDKLKWINRLELFLYYCNMWKISYWLRKEKNKLKRRLGK